MPIRFGSHRNDDEEDEAPRRGRPPDYRSRGVRFRLWLLVGMTMLVITLAVEARNPKHYAWMWRLGKPEQKGAIHSPREVRDDSTRPVSRAKPAIPIAPEQIPGSIHSAEQPAPLELSTGADAELLARTRKDGWTRVFEQLPPDEREPTHDLLFALLRAARAGSEASGDERLKGAQLLALFDQAWTTYRADAVGSLATVSEEEKKDWLAILNALEREWSAESRPALQALVAGQPPDDQQRAALDRLQKLLDQLAIDAIQDNTVPNRSAERFAWFRLFEVLGGASEQELKQASHGTVGYVQLLKQPKDYRAKLVTIKGTVQLGYRVPAFENVEGIKYYYIFWMRPAEGVDSPYVIYALETPPGFPPVLDKDDRNQATNRLDVQAEFTGYFFKRMAYLSRKDTRTTPLLLARAPHYDGQSIVISASPKEELPSLATFVAIVGGTAAFGLAVAVFAFVTTRRPRQAMEFPAEVSAADLQRLEAMASAKKAAEKPAAIGPK